MSISIVTGDNLGSDFDLGVEEAGKINIKRATNTVPGLVTLQQLNTTTMASLEVNGSVATMANSAATNLVKIYSTTSMGVNVGGSVSLGGWANTANDAARAFAVFAGRKETATSGDLSGYFHLLTPNSGGTLTEQLRVTSTGNLLLGNTANQVSAASFEPAGLVRAASSKNSSVSITTFNTGGQVSTLSLGRSNSATIGTLSTTAASSVLGVLSFEGVNSATTAAWAAGASIKSTQVGTPTTTGIPSNLVLSTSNGASLTERVHIDSLGNIGLSMSPSSWHTSGKAIETSGGSLLGFSTNQICLFQNIYYDNAYRYKTSAPASTYEQNTGEHYWKICGTGSNGTAAPLVNAMKLDANGRLLLNGATAYGEAAAGMGLLQVQVTTGAAATMSRWSANASSTSIQLLKSRGGAVGTHAAVLASDSLGQLLFGGSDGAAFQRGALIEAVAEANASAGSMPSYLWFGTTPSGSATALERLRINSSGFVGIGTGQSIPDYFTVTRAQNSPTAIRVENTSTTALATARLVSYSDVGYTALETTSSNYSNAGNFRVPNATVLQAGANNDALQINAAKSTGYVAFYTGGSAPSNERVRIDSVGNVGIGTVSHSSCRLTVSHGLGATAVSINTNAAPTAAGQRIGALFFGSDTETSTLGQARVEAFSAGAWTAGTSAPTYMFFSTTPSGSINRLERVRIDSDGNVGIGGIAAVKLDVFSGVDGAIIRARQATSTFEAKLGTSVNSAYVDAGNTDLALRRNGTEVIRLATGDLVCIGQTSGTNKLEVNGGVSINGGASLPSAVTTGWIFSNDTTVKRMFVGDGTGNSFRVSRRVSNTTTDIFTVTDSASGAQVGINQATPVAALDVNGLVCGNTQALGGGTAVNVALGNFFSKTITANTTFTFTGAPNTRAVAFSIELTNGGDYLVTWPASVKWPSGTAPSLTSGGVDLLSFITRDGGSTWRGVLSMKDSR